MSTLGLPETQQNAYLHKQNHVSAEFQGMDNM